jgi:hypothetical protein
MPITGFSAASDILYPVNVMVISTLNLWKKSGTNRRIGILDYISRSQQEKPSGAS